MEDPTAAAFAERDRCCFCSWMPYWLTGRSFLQCLSLTCSLGILVLLIVALIAAVNLQFALDSHDYVYGGSPPFPPGMPRPFAFNPCVFPSIWFNNTTEIPPYLNSSACISNSSCCPKGYSLADNTCYSTTFQCSSDYTTQCLALSDDATIIESSIDFGLIRLLNKDTAIWAFALGYILLPVAILCWGLEIVYWWRRRNTFVGKKISSEELPIRQPVAAIVNDTPPDLPHNEYSYICCASIIVGCVMGVLILTGGLPLVFANQPNIDGTDVISNCFDSSATVGDPAILGSMSDWYHAIILPTIFSALGIIFCLLFQMIYMLPPLYFRMWNWCMFFAIMITTGIIMGVTAVITVVAALV